MDQYGAPSHAGEDPAYSGDVSRPEPLRPVPTNVKAAHFEDEKRRITASCFSKRDDSGKLLQSYITHVRVEEDSAYQSTPAPPGGNPAHKKARVIILAVKSSGRVSMHKARENEDGQFQIGKTWGLEELQSIETFSSSLPKSPEDQQRANWAGPTGFLIRIGKPYYWQAKTPKEKDFFIGSLVKVFNKFTGGRMPELVGFDPKEQAAILASIRPASSGTLRTQSSRGRLATGQQDSRSSSQGQQPASVHSAYQSPPAGSPQPPVIQGQYRSPPAPGYDQRRPPEILGVTDRTSQTTGRRPSASPYGAANGVDEGRRPYQSRGGQPSVMTSPSAQTQSSASSARPSVSASDSYEDYMQQSQLPGFYGGPGASPVEERRLAPQSSRPSIRSNANQKPAPSGPRVADAPVAQASHPPAMASVYPAASSDAAPLPSRSASRKGVQLQESYTNGAAVAPAPPERRRPPLQDSIVNGRSTPSTSSRPRTPAATEPANDVRQLAPTVPPILPADAGQPTPPPSDRISEAASSERDALETEAKDEDSNFRPGLGPMTGKRSDVANKMRKAVNAHRAFVPRAGGAGDRLLGKAKPAEANVPDGITAVVPAPARAVTDGTDGANDDGVETSRVEKRMSPPPLKVPVNLDAQVPRQYEPEVAPAPAIEEPQSRADPYPEDFDISPEAIPKPLFVSKQKGAEKLEPKRRPNPFANALADLGIDPSFGQDERVRVFEDHVNEFGWDRNFLQKKQFDVLQAKMRREVGKLEAGDWLGHSEDGDARVAHFEETIDRAIKAVDEVDSLLTLYTVELSTLVEDVAYIEAQSQGLQVQTANQKLLYSELDNLIRTVSIEPSQIDALRASSLNDNSGLEAVESALALLFKALERIDPISVNRGNTVAARRMPGQGMRALQERKEVYMAEATSFLHRFKKFTDQAFVSAFQASHDYNQRASLSHRDVLRGHDTARHGLWRYSPLILFAREVNPMTWDNMLKSYQARAQTVYQQEILDSVVEWQRRTHKPSSDDQYALFTTLDKEPESLASAARKMTVKRSATLVRSFRGAAADKRPSLLRGHDAEVAPHEAFAGILQDMVPAIMAEQNFVVDFFHASVVGSVDFLDAIALERPADRRGHDLVAKRPPEPAGNRSMAEKVKSVMEAIFGAWSIKVQEIITWALKYNDFQAVGMLCTLERLRTEFEDTNQDYILRVTSSQQRGILQQWSTFVDTQIRAIDNAKLKSSKRRGLMPFTRRLPNFVNAVENVVPVAETPLTGISPRLPSSPRTSEIAQAWQPLESRKMIDECYERVLSAIFRNLDTVNRDAPNLGGDAEDKDKLNHEILLIENMHYIATALEVGSNLVLTRWRSIAEQRLQEHRTRYVEQIVRRPLGRLLDFVDAIGHDAARRQEMAYSRAAFKKVLGGYDAKACRRDVEAIRKRVEKHFAEDEAGAGPASPAALKLVGDVLDACRRKMDETIGRVEWLAGRYEPAVELEVSRQDVGAAFRR